MRVAQSRHFRGRFTLPGDKSLSHRLAILAALAQGESRFANFSTAEDCNSTLRCLEALGVSTRRAGRSVVEVVGRGPASLQPSPAPLDAGNSGSTLRMLAGVVAARPFRTVITGDSSLRRRPVERVAEPLRAMGATAVSTDGRPPLTIDGASLKGITWPMSAASAQVKTAILLAGLQASGRTTVVEPSPTRDHTERLLPAFGVSVDVRGAEVSVSGGGALQPLAWDVPGDVSSAAFLVVAALIVPEAFIHVENVLLNPRRTAFLDVLRRMGAHLDSGVRRDDPEPVGWLEARTSHLKGTEVKPDEVAGLIDEVPILAVAAACAEGELVVRGAGELRIKESDRIAALCEGLRRMGADVEEHPDGLTVRGGPRLRGASVRSHGDHRIAMALAVAGLAASGDTEIEDAECVAISFPEFPSLLDRGRKGER
ncbi:MAG: 3-phosphoshikimate 1-carboxyvinyltransferase [Acidobacteria bacterium]|nr:MAG: 3-phosphoshikimate 1-carboxyvinyltransferase [Acidobacteriota bacterium]